MRVAVSETACPSKVGGSERVNEGPATKRRRGGEQVEGVWSVGAWAEEEEVGRDCRRMEEREL